VRRVSQEIDLSKKKRKRKLGETLTKVHSEKSKSSQETDLFKKKQKRMLGEIEV